MRWDCSEQAMTLPGTSERRAHFPAASTINLARSRSLTKCGFLTCGALMAGQRRMGLYGGSNSVSSVRRCMKCSKKIPRMRSCFGVLKTHTSFQIDLLYCGHMQLGKSMVAPMDFL